MKRILLGVITSIMICILTGCTETTTVNVNVEGSSELNNTVLGDTALVNIGNQLYYDSTTRIVYWWNGSFVSNAATTPSPFIAPNGLPYRYNPETNTFEEINNT